MPKTATKPRTRRSPVLTALRDIESSLDRAATALERIAFISTRATGDVFGEPGQRFVRVGNLED